MRERSVDLRDEYPFGGSPFGSYNKSYVTTRRCPILDAGMAVLTCAQTSMSRRQRSLAPHSSTPFMARAFTLS